MKENIINLENIKISLLFFLIALIAHLFLHFFFKKVKKTKKINSILIDSISAPLKIFIWYVYIYQILNFLNIKNPLFIKYIDFIHISPILIIALLLFKTVSNIESSMIHKKVNFNKDYITLFSRILKIIIAFLITLTIAEYFGFSISSIVTFGGVGGIVIGFAAKDLLANIFGGLMIQMDKPFSTGDWIRAQDANIEGIVEKIGWRMTRIRTFSKNPLYIPNSIFSTMPIETPSRMTNRKIREIIGLRYDDINKLPIIIKAVEDFLSKHKNIDTKEPIRVYFDFFNASSIDFVIYAFSNIIDATKFKKMKGELLLDIANIIAKNGAEIAFPTQTIHIEK